MALRIEKAFGVKMDTLMRMQASYDIAEIRKREKKIREGAFTRPPTFRHESHCLSMNRVV
jgi:plasmid maintenance system antidote protein VapI